MCIRDRSTILIFEIFRRGIAVASKQAPTAKSVASRMGMTGIATSWMVSLVAASMTVSYTHQMCIRDRSNSYDSIIREYDAFGLEEQWALICCLLYTSRCV